MPVAAFLSQASVRNQAARRDGTGCLPHRPRRHRSEAHSNIRRQDLRLSPHTRGEGDGYGVSETVCGTSGLISRKTERLLLFLWLNNRPRLPPPGSPVCPETLRPTVRVEEGSTLTGALAQRPGSCVIRDSEKKTASPLY